MPIDADLRQRIASSAAVGFADQLAFMQQLVRFPSTRGNEHTVQDFMARELRARGLTVDVFAMEEAAISRHPGGSKISDTHSRAPIVVGIHRPRTETGRSTCGPHHPSIR